MMKEIIMKLIKTKKINNLILYIILYNLFFIFINNVYNKFKLKKLLYNYNIYNDIIKKINHFYLINILIFKYNKIK